MHRANSKIWNRTVFVSHANYSLLGKEYNKIKCIKKDNNYNCNKYYFLVKIWSAILCLKLWEKFHLDKRCLGQNVIQRKCAEFRKSVIKTELFWQAVIWENCDLGKLWCGQSVIWTKCDLYKVWFVQSVFWTKCILDKVWCRQSVMWTKCDVDKVWCGQSVLRTKCY